MREEIFKNSHLLDLDIHLNLSNILIADLPNNLDRVCLHTNPDATLEQMEIDEKKLEVS